jgi:hypothetical protein
MSPLFGKPESTDATGRFDRVAFRQPDGGILEITGEEFDKLPLAERIKVILDGKPKFWLNGKEVALLDAVRRR